MSTVPESGFATFEAPMSHETFGGNVNKKNYGQIAVVDPETDTSAEQGVDACRVLACLQNMGKFAELEAFIGTDTPSSSVVSYCGHNGVGLSHAPTVTWIADGIMQFQWDATYTDAYGVTGTLKITRAKAWANNTFQAIANAWKVDERTVWVYSLNASTGDPVNSAGFVLEVSTMGDT